MRRAIPYSKSPCDACIKLKLDCKGDSGKKGCRSCRESETDCQRANKRTKSRAFKSSHSKRSAVSRIKRGLETSPDSDVTQLFQDGQTNPAIAIVRSQQSYKTLPSTEDSRKLSDHTSCLLGDRCIVSHRQRRHKTENYLLECENNECRVSYHFICLMKESPYGMPYSLTITNGFENNKTLPAFVCPRCVDAPKATRCLSDDAVGQFADLSEISETHSLAESLEGQNGYPHLQNGEQFELSNYTTPYLHQHQSQQPFEHRNLEISGVSSNQQHLYSSKDSATQLRVESECFNVNYKYDGFDEDEARSLLRKLHQQTTEYSIELCEHVTRMRHCHPVSGDLDVRPFSIWQRIDSGMFITEGKQWFQIREGEGDSNPTVATHAPITATLRKMLKLLDNQPLDHNLLAFNSDLRDATLTEVQTAFIYWFAFDVINNTVDLYSVPNMKPLKKMVAAISQFAHSRYPGYIQGQEVLREIQLRLWRHDNGIQKDILEWQSGLRKQLDNFIEPLLKICPPFVYQLWSSSEYIAKREAILESAMKLWAYFRLLGGMIRMIQPTIGERIDLDLHDVYTADGLLPVPGSHSGKVISWVISRGFWYEETIPHGYRQMKIKARVVCKNVVLNA